MAYFNKLIFWYISTLSDMVRNIRISEYNNIWELLSFSCIDNIIITISVPIKGGFTHSVLFDQYKSIYILYYLYTKYALTRVQMSVLFSNKIEIHTIILYESNISLHDRYGLSDQKIILLGTSLQTYKLAYYYFAIIIYIIRHDDCNLEKLILTIIF